MQCSKGLTVQRRKWRVLALLNTEATRDPANEDNKVIFDIQASENIRSLQIKVTIPVTMEIPFKDGAVVYEDGPIPKFGVSVMSWQFDELSPAYPLEIISPDELVAFEGEVKREGYTENNLPGTNQPVPTGVGRASENLEIRIFFYVCILLLS